jgi:hypothetical protein
MTNTYTINNTTANSGTITLTNTSGSGYTIGTGITTTGPIYTTTGTGASNWSTSNTQFNGGNGKPVMSMPHGTDEVILEKDATLTVKGKVVINDRDLEERLSTMEKLLQIPERDVKLESKHPKLKQMYDDYIKALAKYRTWEAIKGNDDN